ncbi:polyphosphate kinase 1 [soil metagenome]
MSTGPSKSSTSGPGSGAANGAAHAPGGPGGTHSALGAAHSHAQNHANGRHTNGGVARATAAREAAARDAAADPSHNLDILSQPAIGDGAPVRPDIKPGAKSFNRDLSWLEFNARVLRQAQDDRVPLLERVKFLAIVTSNLDEFVQKRVGWLLRQLSANAQPDGPEAPTPAQMLDTVRKTFEFLEQAQARCYEESIRPALAREGIELMNYNDLSPAEQGRINAWFKESVFPVLTPLAVDPGHRFPFISNLSSNLGVFVSEPGSTEPLFARVKVPWGANIPQWVRVPGEAGPLKKSESGRGRFVQLHDLIIHNLADLFPGLDIGEVVPFRVTRAAEGAAELDSDPGDADNLLDYVEAALKKRRFAKIVRLEVATGATPRFVRELVAMFQIQPEDVDPSIGLLDFRSLFEMADLPRPELKYPVWQAAVPARLADRDSSIFDIIRRGDVLVHHPYESFAGSAERFIAEAASDPAVLAIKQTIYRTSRDSPFVQHLIRAAESGKQVACLVELRARFDESRNVKFAQALEKAGVHVAYGVMGLKTHCKAALVVRKEPDGLRRYAHLGTGNYNSATATLYTDLGLLTSDPEITADVADLFNLLTGRSRKTDYKRLLVAPATMKKTFLDLIAREGEFAAAHARGAGASGGRIVAKMNALEDRDIARALYDASQRGAKIDLFIRGFCCLRPGVAGLSENITVTSIVGRYLEHSRLFCFGAGKADPVDADWFIGSADWMHRNLEQRVEAVCPVLDPAARQKLLRVIEVMSHDRRSAWELSSDGKYVPRRSAAALPGAELDEATGTFDVLMNDAARGM